MSAQPLRAMRGGADSPTRIICTLRHDSGHRVGIFIDVTSLKCYIYSPFKNPNTTTCLEVVESALQQASNQDSTFN